MLSYYVINCEKFRKVLQWTEKVALRQGKEEGHIKCATCKRGRVRRGSSHKICQLWNGWRQGRGSHKLPPIKGVEEEEMFTQNVPPVQEVEAGEGVTQNVPRAGRDVYRIESIISYRYHKTDTSIVPKWQINDTFNDTFMMILIRIELVWHKNEWFFLLNACFVFHFYIILKIMVPE